jgi:hypothetical protein
MDMPRVEYNLLELRPQRLWEWEEEAGRVVVLVPKFRHRWLAPWLMPVLRNKYFRVKLDGLGSAVWRQCDGETDVATIAGRVQSEFGPAAEPLHERIGTFLKKLEHGELVKIPPPTEISHATTKKED